MITETSAVGSDEVREKWLHSSISMIKTLRCEGVPVVGYTWFPLFTMIDWRYRFSQEPLENFYLELGLYHLNRMADGPRWIPSQLVPEMRKYISDPLNAIGEVQAPVSSEAPSLASNV
jgi:hypothetical protein